MAEPKIMATMPYDMTLSTLQFTGQGGGTGDPGYKYESVKFLPSQSVTLTWNGDFSNYAGYVANGTFPTDEGEYTITLDGVKYTASLIHEDYGYDYYELYVEDVVDVYYPQDENDDRIGLVVFKEHTTDQITATVEVSKIELVVDEDFKKAVQVAEYNAKTGSILKDTDTGAIINNVDLTLTYLEQDHTYVANMYDFCMFTDTPTNDCFVTVNDVEYPCKYIATDATYGVPTLRPYDETVQFAVVFVPLSEVMYIQASEAETVNVGIFKVTVDPSLEFAMAVRSAASNDVRPIKSYTLYGTLDVPAGTYTKGVPKEISDDFGSAGLVSTGTYTIPTSDILDARLYCGSDSAMISQWGIVGNALSISATYIPTSDKVLSAAKQYSIIILAYSDNERPATP